MKTREQLMADVERRAYEARIELSPLCHQAGLSRTIAYRWKRREAIPSMPTIGKLESKLAELESKQSAGANGSRSEASGT